MRALAEQKHPLLLVELSSLSLLLSALYGLAMKTLLAAEAVNYFIFPPGANLWLSLPLREGRNRKLE